MGIPEIIKDKISRIPAVFGGRAPQKQQAGRFPGNFFLQGVMRVTSFEVFRRYLPRQTFLNRYNQTMSGVSHGILFFIGMAC